MVASKRHELENPRFEGKRRVLDSELTTQAAISENVLLFDESYGLGKDLLGGKGHGLVEMTHAGLPVPPGITITTRVCNDYYSNGQRFPKDLVPWFCCPFPKPTLSGRGVRIGNGTRNNLQKLMYYALTPLTSIFGCSSVRITTMIMRYNL